ncbi:MAG: hypothetical protein H0W09_08365 [Solirubrobacterales bacterium]|nr:hypothetical protein [Solirubrobacterales bacterium]
MTRFVLVVAAMLGASLGITAVAQAGHGLLDHPAQPFAPQAPISTEVNSGGKGANWELIDTIVTGNPHTDLDFFRQGNTTYASVGTLGAGPNSGGQTIVQLKKGKKINPRLVTAHPSASCISNAGDALGLQHDVEATPKSGGLLNARNPFAERSRTQLLIDATDAPGRCHDQGEFGVLGAPQGGLEIVDVTDVEDPVEIGLTSHIGESHTVNIDPKRPHIAYSVTSDLVSVNENGKRENTDPNDSDAFDLDGFEVVDMSSCMNFPQGLSNMQKRNRCRPEVYRYRYPTTKLSLGHTLQTGVYGCHELEVYPSDLLTCGSGSALIGLDMSRAFDDNGTPNDYSDDTPRGKPLPCTRRASTSLSTATGAMITDCVNGKGAGDDDLTVAKWLKGKTQKLRGVRWVGSVHHQGRGAGGPNPAFNSQQDIDFNHEAELSASGRFLISSDERGGGVVPPGAGCNQTNFNLGNGGLHFYRFDRLKRAFPESPKEAFKAYARKRQNKKSANTPKAIYRTPVRTQPQETLCTAHVFQQIPGQNRIFMGWYSQGTQVVDFRERRDGTLKFRNSGYFIPENANTWVSHIFDVKKRKNGKYTYFGATGDFNLGAAGRSAIDIYKVTLPAPPKPAAPFRSDCRGGRATLIQDSRGRPYSSKADCLDEAVKLRKNKRGRN